MRAYRRFMTVRRLFAILIALAVLFAPAMTRVGEAQAAVPDHHAQMMTKGHCDTVPAGDQEQARDSNSCCVQLSMAVAAEPARPAASQPLLGASRVAALENFRTGTPAELATPPPRAA